MAIQIDGLTFIPEFKDSPVPVSVDVVVVVVVVVVVGPEDDVERAGDDVGCTGDVSFVFAVGIGISFVGVIVVVVTMVVCDVVDVVVGASDDVACDDVSSGDTSLDATSSYSIK